MSRSTTMAQLLRMARLAERCARTGASADDAIGEDALEDAGRRRLIHGATAGAAVIAAGAAAPHAWATMQRAARAMYARVMDTRGVGIVGAGLAGLACADELVGRGARVQVYDAASRVGGRVHSARGVFPGQVAERGAEFIGATHYAVLGYARMLGLPLEELPRRAGTPLFDASGRVYSEAQVIDEYRAFVDCIRADVGALGAPTAASHDEAAATFDFMTVDDYLAMYGASGVLRDVVRAACTAEFGAAPDALSAIAFLRFVHGDTRTKFGTTSATGATQLHVVGGNDLITGGLAARLPEPVQLGHRLVAVSRRGGSGPVRLTFAVGGRYVDVQHDAVVLALPFGMLRDVDFDAGVDLPAAKRLAIAASTMGDGAKLNVGFRAPVWTANARAASGLPSLQNVWEANPKARGATRGVLAYQAGGAAARLMRPETVQGDAAAMLATLEAIVPGAQQAARRDARGKVQADLHNWSLDGFSRGTYTYPRPGYFTTIAGHEATPVGNLFFAGDHTSSFYEWQGFLEGAALSGLRAAAEVASLVLGGAAAAPAAPADTGAGTRAPRRPARATA